MVGRLKSAGRRWSDSATDVLREDPRRLPEVMGKAVVARVLHGLGPESFFMADLQHRPIRTWRDHMKDGSEFFGGLRAVNWFWNGLELAGDKVRTAERCAVRGVPYAPIMAVVGRDTERDPTDGVLPETNSVDDLTGILAGAPDRLFVKPAQGSKGQGAGGAERSEAGWRYTDETLSDRDLAARLLADPPTGGWVVQPRLTNHADIRALMTGSGLGTLRVLVALTHRGPQVLSTGLRLLGGDAPADNFVRGGTGNLAAQVDVASGRIVKVYARHPERRVIFEQLTHHPVSGVALVGVALPCWRETMDFAGRVAAAFPEIPVPGLDIAITDDGPVFMETNSQWSAELSQLIGGEGIRTTLRRVWGDLAAPDEAKAEAARRLGL